MIQIELDGVRRQVALRREGDRWNADINGRMLEVSVAEAGGRWSMLVNPAGAGLHGPAQRGSDLVESGVSRISYDIAFEPAASGELIVHVNGVAIPLTIVNAPGRAARRRRAGRDAAAGPRTIAAPMPGRIVKVLVKPDEAVSAGQPLVVVEAMKMENELRAPRAGTVAEVRVSEGSSVEANTVLVVLR
jgi:biotin carboxyl carrier protein